MASPGSGKSWLSDKLAKSGKVVHSSDAIREELLGNVSAQSNQALVFETLHERVLSDVEAGRDVVYDATNIDFKRRRDFLQKVDCAVRDDDSFLKVCCFMATPYEKCLENNKTRERVVPEDVISRMYHKFDIPMYCEGWDDIWICNTEHKNVDKLMLDLVEIHHDNPHHDFTIGCHCLVANTYAKSITGNSDHVLEMAALLHDIGKRFTKGFQDSHGNPSDVAHYYGHERISAYDSFSYSGWMKSEDKLKTALLIRWHMYPYAIEKSDNPEKTKKKLLYLIGEEDFEKVMLLHECDKHAH